MKPSKETWLYYKNEHIKHQPENFGTYCNDHNRLIAIQDLLIKKGILRMELILEKEWANAGFMVPRSYEHYDDQEIMEICNFKKDIK